MQPNSPTKSATNIVADVGRGLRLSRPPHPYHRNRSDLSDSQQQERPNAAGQQYLWAAKKLALENGNNGGDYFSSHDRKMRRKSTSPSDSGTEADDESGVFLRVLPAPPIKLRKGLKDAGGSAVSSPLLTPTYLDDDRQKSTLENRLRRQGVIKNSAVTDEESLKIREKFTKRRRAELLRRVSETLLLCIVGAIACRNESSSFLHVRKKELASHFCVILCIYLLYPLRIIYRRHLESQGKAPILSSIRIPASFDPAPLLYPTLIPVFITISLAAVNPKIVLPNLVLSISSIPGDLIPFHNRFLSISSVQWLLSLIPLLIVKREQPIRQISKVEMNQFSYDLLNTEEIAILYPLHQILLSSLGFLTTTSLLPAELQLLSISMINLLLFSSSPQTLILKALLWIGGVSVFTLCSTVLEWGVALARVPSWRFRHPQRRSQKGYVVLAAIDDYLNGRLGRWGLVSTAYGSSESDDEVATMEISQWSKGGKPRKESNSREKLASTSPVSAVDGNTRNVFPKTINNPSLSIRQTNRQRRHTLPPYIGSLPRVTLLEKPNFFALSLSSRIKPRFLSLTNSQAIVAKWSFATYVYTVVLIIILVPVRRAVAQGALHDHDPIGWALGYLFGHLPLFRSIVLRLQMDKWICLPVLVESHGGWYRFKWAEYLQHLGAANIRLLICVYCASIIALGLRIVFYLTSLVEVDTRRKIFHGMMVVMFLPSILIDPPFAALALALALVIFLLLDLFRASQLPPLSKPLTYFLAPYVDGRDHRGPVIVSHIFLLIGCAIPLWLSLAAIDRTGIPPWEGWDLPTRDLSMVSGVICVGMGDAAASLFGRRFGRRRWCWSGGKSLEGSCAFVVAVVLGLAMSKLGLQAAGWDGSYEDSWVLTLGKASLAAAGASLTEAILTGGNDNVIVPVILWLLVRGLRV